jgi:tetratricopeptide (TPR) repeat protein
MNAESFVRYLEDANFLHQISYQELKTLSLQYPYCQNLHLLLLKKGYLDNNKDWEKDLTTAATLSFDRTHLFRQIQAMGQKAAVDNFLLNEEFLELKELSELGESILLEEEVQEENKMANPAPSEIPTPDEESFTDLFDASEPAPFLEPEQPPIPGSASSNIFTEKEEVSEKTNHSTHTLQAFFPDPLIEKFIACSEILEDFTFPQTVPAHSSTKRKPSFSSPPILPKLKQIDQQKHIRAHQLLDQLPAVQKRPKPQPKRSFTTWLHDFQEPSMKLVLDEIMEHKKLEEIKKKKKKKKKKKQMLQEAVQSITENEEIASETLAELLIKQGRYDKAIEMYDRLILLFPEKSDYFAAKIKHLKSI